MPCVQQKWDRLVLRGMTADVLARALEGERADIPMDPGTLTKYIQGSITNALEVVLLFLTHLPADRGALIVGAVSDFYEDLHGREVGDAEAELLEKHVADLADDDSRYRLKNPDGSWNRAELQRWVAVSRIESKEAEDARRAVVRLITSLPADRKQPMVAQPSRWRAAEARRSA